MNAHELILIVDDIPSNLVVLSETLNAEGYDVAIATSDERALKQLEQILPDLILLDIQMPNMDGFTVCQKLKINPRTCQIPTIFMTALNDLDSKMKGFELGAVDYITRPFQYREVIARIRTHLQLRRLTFSLEKEVSAQTASLQNAVHEKEILLKEVHHRVKNNLMIIGSLLNWQGESVQDPKLLSILEDSKKRINSIALIHEKLYRSPDLAKIDFGEYLHSLVQQVFSTFSLSHERVRLHCEVASIFLNIETATPCGLVINELVSNALEHAFPEHSSGELFVSLSHDERDQIILMVADNGVGFPEGVDFRQTESLGWQLVCLLTEQLEGDVQLFRESGTRVVISFSELNYQRRV
ncbi:histidine kinase dimerization/phosphoacceptor domain -containing protein [Pseudanabaena mucicola]|uniref:histidine kinase dimerization/phosphoacceptor domain -containing protein n=1 Tax=Pseudanabaena mucicola TaxID=71190 RepID=UPI002574D3EE|nr:histidine kinase dimerization/phosphoacceptor domain -containing protein [Pseudanabaena mucicola]